MYNNNTHLPSFHHLCYLKYAISIHFLACSFYSAYFYLFLLFGRHFFFLLHFSQFISNHIKCKEIKNTHTKYTKREKGSKDNEQKKFNVCQFYRKQNKKERKNTNVYRTFRVSPLWSTCKTLYIYIIYVCNHNCAKGLLL